MPFEKVLVAITNKLARKLWAMLARDVDYDPPARVERPMAKLYAPTLAETAMDMA